MIGASIRRNCFSRVFFFCDCIARQLGQIYRTALASSSAAGLFRGRSMLRRAQSDILVYEVNLHLRAAIEFAEKV